MAIGLTPATALFGLLIATNRAAASLLPDRYKKEL